MKVYGLTGGIGTGKSTAAEILQKRGVAVIDTDAVARQVVEPGQAALAEIQQAFGKDVLQVDGTLNRQALAQAVFNDENARKQLEAILHPRIRAVWQAEVERWRAAGIPIGFVVIPLLFETKAESCFDATICLACSNATQRLRLAARGWTPEQSSRRLAAQWPLERKMQAATYVVWTEGEVAALAEQLDRIIG